MTTLALQLKERARRAAIIAVIGAGTAIASLKTLRFGFEDGSYIFCAAMGAGLAGALTAPLFGRANIKGGWLALLGAGLSLLLGAALGGVVMILATAETALQLRQALGEPLFLLLAGPTFVIWRFTLAPLAAVLCLCAFAALHWHLRQPRP